MSETTARPAVQWFCPWHGYVDTLPCPFCPQAVTTTTGVQFITEAELEMRLEAARRSYEARWNDQRTAVARMLAESTQELRDQIGILEARIADQDSLIAQLRSDLDRQSRLDDLTYEIACATEVFALRQREQIRGLRARVAGQDVRGLEKRCDVAIGDLSFASTRQDEQIKALEAQIAGLERRLAAPVR